MTPSALPELFRDLLCQPRRADLLCTTSTPRVLPGGAFAHLIRTPPSVNLLYDMCAIPVRHGKSHLKEWDLAGGENVI